MLSPTWLLIQGFWLLIQGFLVLRLLWFISIPLTGLILFSIYRYKRQKIKFSKSLFYWLSYPILLPVIIAFLGGLFYDTDNYFVDYSLYFLIIVDLVYSIFLLIKFKKYRIFIISLTSLFILFALGVVFVSLMSIANDWI